ncbi:dual oxidase 2-like [Haliotis asinina]|uniref:dual oxidase 2-like n=1 Tax=Haliotis asinina TaxID=109174 RepID=UPI0035319655
MKDHRYLPLETMLGVWICCSFLFFQDTSGVNLGTTQRFDGLYNNLGNPTDGGTNQPLARNITSSYTDFTYIPSGQERPNPRSISNDLFKGDAAIPSFYNRTALFAFFGQLVQREISDTDDATCPVEIIEIPIPRGDPDFDPESKGDKSMPYERIAYARNSGHSPNNPRKQINKASSYIDGSFVYGSSVVRTGYLREHDSGKLACQDNWGRYPKLNDIRLPFKMYPDCNQKMINPEELWRLGDTHVYENPGILSLGVLFFRYHNYRADHIRKYHPNLSSDEIFERSRRWVIASLQKVIVYDWLPMLLNTSIPNYTGYRPTVQSKVTDLFDATAIKYIDTLIPSGLYQRTDKCKFLKTHRLCNTYWNAKDVLFGSMKGTEETLLGLASQQAEGEDRIIVEDLRSKFYGPLFYSRHDSVVLNIMKGRDYGLPDYNTARREMGLDPITSWGDINPWLNATEPEVIERMRVLHNDNLDNIDIYVGGMMETTPRGPGELFSLIIMDQFLRLRDGDRFWFENSNNGIFSDEEVAEIMSITMYDIIVNTTKIMKDEIQQDVFTVSDNDPCPMPSLMNSSMLGACPAHKGYNFFSGSEIPYVIIWTCIGVIPLACILVAYVLAKCKKWRHLKRVKDAREEKERKRILRRTLSSSVSVHETQEWCGKDAAGRCVELHLTSKETLEVFSTEGTHLRTIKLLKMSIINITISNNKGRNVLMVHVPKEYDLVLEFPSEVHRNDFEQSLTDYLNSYSAEFVVQEMSVKELYDMAMTKTKRNAQLEKFFKTVFAEAFQMDYDPTLDQVQLDMKKQTKEILQCELSKEEFAEALAVKADSDFVEHFFCLIDSDRNGYISFREFLNAVVLFSKGTCQDKLQTMFYMYDLDGSGVMTKKEICQMFRSLLELAQSNLQSDEVEQLVESLSVQAGLADKENFRFEDFCQILSPQMDMLWGASIDWKGIKNCLPNEKSNHKAKSDSEVRQRTNSHQTSGSQSSTDSITSPSSKRSFTAVREKYTPVKAKIKMAKHFVENYRAHIFFLVMFFGITLGLAAERFYFYTVQREQSGLRKLMSYGISMTRGAAAAMSFTFSLLLLTMCRNTITFLRSTFLNFFIPFDSMVSFHKVVAWTALFFSAVHVIGYSFNFYSLATQPTRFLCIFDSIVLRAEALPTFTFWLFGNMTGFTGVLLVVVLCIIYVFATQTARRHIFNLFWLTHKLFIVMYVLVILHGASVIVQKPLFYAYFVGPAVLFTIDKMVSLSRKKVQISIVRAQNLPSDVTMLEFKRPSKFEYKSGQWVRIACLSQGKDEYHPFTLTSAPHEDTLKVHIRALGPWTWNIRQTFDSQTLKDNPLPKLYLDGPYGAGQQDWYQYEVSVLVGAGIGVTPYASILKDFVHMSSIRSMYKVKCQKLYFIWITGSQRHFEWLIDILREVEEIDTMGMVSIDIFITQFFQNFDLRTAMLYIFEEHFQKMTGGKSVFTGLKATTHFGRPQLNKIMNAVHRAHPQVKKVGVFSCGPPGVTKGVERACVDSSKMTKALFEHHFENF